MQMSDAYQIFEQEAFVIYAAWMETAMTLEKASVLEKKTKELSTFLFWLPFDWRAAFLFM